MIEEKLRRPQNQPKEMEICKIIRNIEVFL
jgi:hypothetical protein